MTLDVFDLPVHEGQVVEGKVHLLDKGSYDVFIREHFGEGEAIEVIVRPAQTRQGNPALRYYFGPIINAIRKGSGYTDPADNSRVHDGLAWRFLAIPGTTPPRRRSVSKGDLSREELRAYVDAVINYAQCDLFIPIPPPDRSYRLWREQEAA